MGCPSVWGGLGEDMDRFRPAESRASDRHPAANRQPISTPPPPSHDSALPFELAAVRHLVDPAVLDAAARRASGIGVGGDEVLRACSVLPPDIITKAIAEKLGIAFDPLEDELPADGPLLEALKDRSAAPAFCRRHTGHHHRPARAKAPRSRRRDPAESRAAKNPMPHLTRTDGCLCAASGR